MEAAERVQLTGGEAQINAYVVFLKWSYPCSVWHLLALRSPLVPHWQGVRECVCRLAAICRTFQYRSACRTELTCPACTRTASGWSPFRTPVHLLQERQHLTAAQSADTLSTRCLSTAGPPPSHPLQLLTVTFAIDKWISAAQWWRDTDRGNWSGRTESIPVLLPLPQIRQGLAWRGMALCQRIV